MSRPSPDTNKRKSVFNESPTINVGSSSLLMIFVVLCLVSFATLSIASAYADQKLSSKVADHSTAYYEACNQAETRIGQIDEALYSYYHDTTSEEEYFAKAGHSISFAIPVTDVHTLDINLEILYPETSDGAFYRIVSYNLTPTGTLELDESLPVYE